MNQIRNYIVLLIMFTIFGCNKMKATESNEKRDPYKWPFSQTSIWNMPIGSHAIYVHALLERAALGMTIDEDYIVMTPEEPLMEVYENFAGWDKTKSRCEREGDLLFSAPIPSSFIVSPETWDGATPNSGLAVLLPDKRTIKQTQPFAHCSPNEATSQYMFEDTDLYGEGLYGAHGGSGLSAIGGALRCEELTPTSGPIRHALKVNIFGRKNIYYDEETKGFRWPARAADGYAKNEYYKDRTNPIAKECRMGALLALPVWMDLDSLEFETKPARILAEAFQKFGAYLVDDTAWDVYAIVTEWSPEGRFAEEFEKNWGISLNDLNKNTPWNRDMDKIYLNLHVVVNNGPTAVGGGGTPLMPLAPPFESH